MSMELFGLALAPLYFAIAQVESRNGMDPRADGNIYQIRKLYIDDLNRIYTYHRNWRETVCDRVASEYAMYDYWRFFGYKYARETGKPVTLEVLARIHNGGPTAMTKRTTVNYWNKVKKIIMENGYDIETGRKVGSGTNRKNH